MRIGLFLSVLSSILVSVYSHQFFRGVLVATDDNYEEVIYNPQAKYSFINYYQTNCGYCNKLGPHIETLAEIFNNTQVQIVQLEGKKNKRVRRLENIVGFPTLRLFGFDGTHIASFNSDRNVETIANFIEAHTGIRPNWPESKVINVDESEKVYQLIEKKDGNLLIAFVAPWLEDWNTRLTHFEKLALERSQSGDNLKLLQVDISSELNSKVLTDFRIAQYPTLVYYNVNNGSFRLLDYDTQGLNLKKFETFLADETIGSTYANFEELHKEKELVDPSDDKGNNRRKYGFNKDSHNEQEEDSKNDAEKLKRLREL